MKIKNFLKTNSVLDTIKKNHSKKLVMFSTYNSSVSLNISKTFFLLFQGHQIRNCSVKDWNTNNLENGTVPEICQMKINKSYMSKLYRQQ